MTDQGWGPQQPSSNDDGRRLPQQPIWEQEGWGPSPQPRQGQARGPQVRLQPATGYSYQPPPQQGYPPPQQGYPPSGPGPQGPRKRHTIRNVLLGAVGAIVLIIIIAVVANSNNGVTKAPAASTGTTTPSSSNPAAQPADSATTAPAAPQYTPEQQQAIEAAEQYLQMGTGFSRKGLIQQLDSSAGNGFPRSVARFAVNHIKVNWNQQAVEAAKGYMQEGGFSYSGMVQQLESPYGNDFTASQAVYGAKAVGL
jgi:Host cell surface-exposed lipoprotein